jgi:DisA bacterial checkpoint controller nucleotide-binding
VSSYPRDLITSIRSVCKSLNSVKFHKPPSLPSNNILERFLDVAFHASFQTEEGRRPGFRIILYSPKDHSRMMKRHDVSPKYFENSFRLMPLDTMRPYSVAEVNRLAPAAEMKRLLICVAVSQQERLDPALQIWALLDTGENWWKFVHHEADKGRPPPNFLTVTSTSPGEVSVSAQGNVLATLRNGQILRPTANVLRSGPLSDFLDSARQRLYEAVIEELKAPKYDPEGHDNDYPQRFYTFFLERVLFYTRQRGHGGTILMVPNYLSQEDTRLTDRIAIKYPCTYTFVWELLIKTLVTQVKYYRLHFPLWDGKTKVTKNQFQEHHMLESEKEELDEALTDVAQSIASLTSVDGAVVLSDHFHVIGFGAEVIASSPSLLNVLDASQLRKPHTIPITSFGTRHRAAFRFCSSLEEAAAFVVSQDGGVKAVKRVGKDVVFWPDINTGAMGI